MYGNGCAGSTASGVSTGNTRFLNSRLHCFCSSRVRSFHRSSSMSSLASAGTISSRNSLACRSISADVVDQICSSTSRGISPEAAGTATPAAMRRFRPATRTMKNSSRFEAKIARNRTRSSSGSARVLGELEHPGVEAQPGQLAVEEPVGGQVGGRGVVRRLDVERLGRHRAQVGRAVLRRTATCAASGVPERSRQSCPPSSHHQVNTGSDRSGRRYGARYDPLDLPARGRSPAHGAGAAPVRRTTARRAPAPPGRPGARPGDPAAAAPAEADPGAAARLAADPRGAYGDAAPDPAGRGPSADRADRRPGGPHARRPDARRLYTPSPAGRAGRGAARLPARRRDGLRRPGHPRRDLPAAGRAGGRAGARAGLPARAGAPLPGRSRRLLGGLPVGRGARRGARGGPGAGGRRR